MKGAIDCDVHPTVTGNEVLLPYLETYWRDSVVERGMGSLEFGELSAERADQRAARFPRHRTDTPQPR